MIDDRRVRIRVKLTAICIFTTLIKKFPFLTTITQRHRWCLMTILARSILVFIMSNIWRRSNQIVILRVCRVLILEGRHLILKLLHFFLFSIEFTLIWKSIYFINDSTHFLGHFIKTLQIRGTSFKIDSSLILRAVENGEHGSWFVWKLLHGALWHQYLWGLKMVRFLAV